VNNDRAQACVVAFNIVCSYNGTKDLVQEHIASKVWPLVYEWEIPKETTDSSIPAAAVETTTAQLEKSELESSRTEQQPKLQSCNALNLGVEFFLSFLSPNSGVTLFFFSFPH
jgi:hypothetical protein